MNSKAILKAIERVVRAPIRFVCQVEHYYLDQGSSKKNDLLICLGEHEFFMMTVDMKTYRGEVSYPHILRVIRQAEDHTPADVIVLELSEDRRDNIPARVTFVTPSREKLLKHLRCYWQADYMFRLGTIRTLYVEQEEISMKVHKAAMKKLDIPLPFMRPYHGFNKIDYGNYSFFVVRGMTLISKAYGEFSGKIQPSSSNPEFDYNLTMNITIDDERLADSQQSALKYKADCAAERIVGTDEDYWMITNEPYLKGNNLAQDISAWQGWWVKLRTPTLYIIVILLRRKFIPPLMEASQDIMIIGKASTDPEEIIRMIVDSLHSNQMLVKPYKDVIDSKASALLMSEETAGYLQSMNYRPDEAIEKWAFLFLYSLAYNIKMHGSGDSQSDMLGVLEILNKNKYIIASKPGIDSQTFEAFVSSPMNSVNKLMGLYSVPEEENKEGGAEPKELERSTWYSKVARYLGYCLDGGLMYSQFVLADVTKAVVSGALTTAAQDEIRKALDFMLHIRQDKKLCLDTSLGSRIVEITKPQVDSSILYVYNEKVMVAYMEQEFIMRELDLENQLDSYYSFLDQLLTSGSTELKAAACRDIIRISIARKEESPFKGCINSLLLLFSRNDYKLATLAAFALVNLSRSGKDIKELIFNEREMLFKRLRCKEHMLLTQTIKIFNNLVTNQTYRVSLKDRLPKEVISIMTPPSIPDAIIPASVIDACMDLLSVLTKDSKIRNSLMKKNREDFMAIIGLMKERFDCETQVLSLVTKLCAKDKTAQEILSEHCTEHFCERLNKVSIFTANQSGRYLLQLILLLIEKNLEFKQKMIEANVVSKLHKILQAPTTDQPNTFLLNKLGIILSY